LGRRLLDSASWALPVPIRGSAKPRPSAPFRICRRAHARATQRQQGSCLRFMVLPGSAVLILTVSPSREGLAGSLSFGRNPALAAYHLHADWVPDRWGNTRPAQPGPRAGRHERSGRGTGRQPRRDGRRPAAVDDQACPLPRHPIRWRPAGHPAEKPPPRRFASDGLSPRLLLSKRRQLRAESHAPSFL
jgi:hypothetical protein